MHKSAPSLTAPGGTDCSLKYSKDTMNQRGEDTGCVWGDVSCTEHPASQGREKTSSPTLTAPRQPRELNLVFELCRERIPPFEKQETGSGSYFGRRKRYIPQG